ncbi:MAG: right-handed parallel beta-helix repeat-containing protein [Rikenellaceae bacterium]
MKKYLLTFIAAMLASCGVASETFYYVSPSGNDKNVGSLDAPFKTLYGAQEKVREHVKKNPGQDITIFMREGMYQFSKTLRLSFEDVAASLTIAGYKDERAIISSGKKVTGWKKCDNYPVNTPSKAKGNLWVADLPQGVGNFKSMFDGERMLTRAKGEKFTKTGATNHAIQSSRGRARYKMISFDDQIKDWDNITDVEVFLNPAPWTINFIPLERVDAENKVAYLEYEASRPAFSYKKELFAWVENVVDYLDEPGEWCVNTKTRKIYYWPEEGKPSDEIYVPMLREIIKVEGKIQYDEPEDIPVKNIHFKNLSFMHGDRSTWQKDHTGWGIQHDWDTFDYDNAILRFRGAESCSVTGCEFICSGGSALRLDLHAQKINIEQNYISDMGHGGILLCGYGAGTKDVNKHNKIHNNIISHIGKIISHGNAIFIWQSGENVISHNYLHDLAREAIDLSGPRCSILMKPDNELEEAGKTFRWHEINPNLDKSIKKIMDRYERFLHSRNNIVERNHIERAMLVSSDGGIINISGAGYGNIIRHNYIYDQEKYNGMRTDDWQDNTIMEGNILHNLGFHGVQYKGVNTLRNNIFINCATALHFMPYGMQSFVSEGTIVQRNIIYSENKDDEPNNVFPVNHPNIRMRVSESKPMPYEYEMDYNAYFGGKGQQVLNTNKENGVEKNGVYMNPEFKDLAKRDYTIQNKELIKAIGFEEFECTLDSFGVTSSYPKKWLKKDYK